MEWNRGAIIGRGATSTVSLATATSSGDLFAVKSTNLSSSTLLQREKDFLSHLNSPHIVKYLGFEISHQNNIPMYNLFMEYAPFGTISDAIKRFGGSIDESMIRFYTNQILLGVDYLHKNNLVHCDIKSQNVLIFKNSAKIGDLGCTRFLGDGNLARSDFSGTPVFMAPEVARGEEQSFPADIWALGCTIIEMATGSNPWPEIKDPISALHRIGFSGELPEFPWWFSDEAKDFLSKCLKSNSKERWTAKQLLQHPFLCNLESNFDESNEISWNSPTMVLDQSFWDSIESPETSRNQTQIGSSANSPAERVRNLIGGHFPLDLNTPNWDLDEDFWITVRSNQIEESLKVSEQNCNITPDVDEVLLNSETIMFSIFNFEEFGFSFIDEYLLLESFVEKISSNIDGLSESFRDVIVLRVLNFDMIMIMLILFLLEIQVFLPPFLFPLKRFLLI